MKKIFAFGASSNNIDFYYEDKNTQIIISSFIFATVQFSFGQVTTTPGFPRSDQKIKIIYDASKGTTSLIGVNPVYIHIGAVIQNSTSSVWGIVPFEWGPPIQMQK